MKRPLHGNLPTSALGRKTACFCVTMMNASGVYTKLKGSAKFLEASSRSHREDITGMEEPSAPRHVTRAADFPTADV